MTEGSAPAGHGHEGSAVAVGTGGTLRVVADRDRLLIWRDPMRRMPWLMVAVLTVAWPFIVVPRARRRLRGRGDGVVVRRAGGQPVRRRGLRSVVAPADDHRPGAGPRRGARTRARRGRARHGDRGHRGRRAGNLPGRPRQDPGGARPVPRRAAGRDRGGLLHLGPAALRPTAEPEVDVRLQRSRPEGPDLRRHARHARRRSGCCPARRDRRRPVVDGEPGLGMGRADSRPGGRRGCAAGGGQA